MLEIESKALAFQTLGLLRKGLPMWLAMDIPALYSLCNSSRLQAHDPPASASWVLEFSNSLSGENCRKHGEPHAVANILLSSPYALCLGSHSGNILHTHRAITRRKWPWYNLPTLLRPHKFCTLICARVCLHPCVVDNCADLCDRPQDTGQLQHKLSGLSLIGISP